MTRFNLAGTDTSVTAWPSVRHPIEEVNYSDLVRQSSCYHTLPALITRNILHDSARVRSLNDLPARELVSRRSWSRHRVIHLLMRLCGS